MNGSSDTGYWQSSQKSRPHIQIHGLLPSHQNSNTIPQLPRFSGWLDTLVSILENSFIFNLKTATFSTQNVVSIIWMFVLENSSVLVVLLIVVKNICNNHPNNKRNLLAATSYCCHLLFNPNNFCSYILLLLLIHEYSIHSLQKNLK